MLLKPTIVLNSVLDIDIKLLNDNNIKALILDLDNTLTTHNNHKPAEGVLDWIAKIQDAGIKLIIVSNNTVERVTPFAKELGLDFIPNGKKPLFSGFKRAQERLELPFENIAIVGDQLFTDMLGANLKKIKAIFVFPFEIEPGIFFKIKRFIERPFLPKRKEF